MLPNCRGVSPKACSSQNWKKSSKIAKEKVAKKIKEEGLSLGFKHVAAGPLVRSSYHANEQHEAAV